MCRTVCILTVLYGCETCNTGENYVMSAISCTLHHIKENKIGRACSMHMKDEKCTQNIGWKTSREEITWKAQPQTRGHYDGSQS